jgi:hypothetical protein
VNCTGEPGGVKKESHLTAASCVQKEKHNRGVLAQSPAPRGEGTSVRGNISVMEIRQ